MNIMSIDASTKSCGVAIYQNNILTYYDCLTASSTDLIKRIQKITKELQDVLNGSSIDVIVLEEVRPQVGQYGVGNIQTHRALMWLQAAIAFMVHDNFPKIKIEYVYPSEWRKVLGIKQGAGVKRETLKTADIQWVKTKFNIDVNDDIADAIGIGFSYLKDKEAERTTKPATELNWE